MNDKEPRLGKFKMQFLAWIQLEKKTQVVTGEVAEAFDFDQAVVQIVGLANVLK